MKIVRRDRFGGLEAVDSRGVILKFGADADLAAKLALVEPIRHSVGGPPAARDRPPRAGDAGGRISIVLVGTAAFTHNI